MPYKDREAAYAALKADPVRLARYAATSAARYQRNKERLSEKRRARYAANRDAVLAQNQAWHEKNLERHRELCRRWARCNPEAARALVARRRALLLQVGGVYGKNDIAAMRQAQADRCTTCATGLAAGYHVDHVIPLSRGGSNWPSNLQLLCPTCNRRKGAKLPHELERRAS